MNITVETKRHGRESYSTSNKSDIQKLWQLNDESIEYDDEPIVIDIESDYLPPFDSNTYLGDVLELVDKMSHFKDDFEYELFSEILDNGYDTNEAANIVIDGDYASFDELYEGSIYQEEEYDEDFGGKDNAYEEFTSDYDYVEMNNQTIFIKVI